MKLYGKSEHSAPCHKLKSSKLPEARSNVDNQFKTCFQMCIVLKLVEGLERVFLVNNRAKTSVNSAV